MEMQEIFARKDFDQQAELTWRGMQFCHRNSEKCSEVLKILVSLGHPRSALVGVISSGTINFGVSKFIEWSKAVIVTIASNTAKSETTLRTLKFQVFGSYLKKAILKILYELLLEKMGNHGWLWRQMIRKVSQMTISKTKSICPGTLFISTYRYDLNMSHEKRYNGPYNMVYIICFILFWVMWNDSCTSPWQALPSKWPQCFQQSFKVQLAW